MMRVSFKDCRTPNCRCDSQWCYRKNVEASPKDYRKFREMHDGKTVQYTSEFDFELVYWADVLHEKPLNPDEIDSENELYLSEPYLPALDEDLEKTHSFREQALEYIEKYSDKIIVNGVLSLNMPSLVDMFIHRHFKDLEIYYTLSFINYLEKKRLAREVIIERLTEVIEKHKNKECHLISPVE